MSNPFKSDRKLRRANEDAGLAETLQPDRGLGAGKLAAETTITGLAIIWHNDPERIGEIAPFHFDRSGSAQLSRLEPNFIRTSDQVQRPLLDQHLSRSPLLIKKIAKREFLFTPPNKNVAFTINGRNLLAPTIYHMDELGSEIIIFLSNTVVLSLFDAPARFVDQPQSVGFGLLGISAEIFAVRQAIVRLATGKLPVLIRGETGTGKELIAAGLHSAGDRHARPMIPVNMATLTPPLAAAELFGVKKGAFTGANSDKTGLFEQANGGVLFLDEIGDTPNEVQPMLLRVIENGEFRRVGDDQVRKTNVRVFAATDRSLEFDDLGHSFNQPLRRRLEAISIVVPPLRKRRCDLGILLRSFLHEQNDVMPRLSVTDLPPTAVHRLALYGWPGNIRELRNVARQLSYGQPLALATYAADFAAPTSRPVVADPVRYENPNLISEDQLLGALDDNNWVVKATAQSLNISRTSLYELMKKSDAIRGIDDISDDELRRVLREVSGGLNDWAKQLRVTRESLARRLRQP